MPIPIPIPVPMLNTYTYTYTYSYTCAHTYTYTYTYTDNILIPVPLLVPILIPVPIPVLVRAQTPLQAPQTQAPPAGSKLLWPPGLPQAPRDPQASETLKKQKKMKVLAPSGRRRNYSHALVA